jgi:AraC-like DNA-binding protein
VSRVPEGIVQQRRASTKFTVTKHEPSDPLRPFVEYYWAVRWDLGAAEPYEQHVLPNLSVHLTFGPGARGVYGPSRKLFTYRLVGAGQVIGARVRPGCFRPFLGRSVRTLSSTPVTLQTLFGPGAREVDEAAHAGRPADELAVLVDELLVANLPPTDPTAFQVAGMIDELAADPSIIRVDQLCARLGKAPRTLQRLFAEYVGAGPKWAIKVYRFHDAAHRIESGDPVDFATLAAQLGYSDQAHFTRDFASVLGTPPAQYRHALD